MRGRWACIGAMAMILLFAGFACAVCAQQDDPGPILIPKKRPPEAKKQPKVTQKLVVTCDLACNWEVMYGGKGHLTAGESAETKVELGQTSVYAKTEDGLDDARQNITVGTEEMRVALDLSTPRTKRLKNEHDCDGGDMAACERAADHYNRLDGWIADYAKARVLYQKACDGGRMSACFWLGTLYGNGQGGREDHAGERTLHQKACDGGYSQACSELGLIYEVGASVSKDPARARAFYQKACSGGYEPGCYSLQHMK